MVKVRKFFGFLAQAPLAHKIISPPYDVLNTKEARIMAGDNEMSFLHVNKPEIDFSDETDPYSEPIYLKGRDNLQKFVHNGWLQKDNAARVYLYAQKMGDHKQIGLMTLASIEDYETQRIKKHELTIEKKEKDRTKLTECQNANIGPVFLTYKNKQTIEDKINEILQKTAPYAHVQTDDHIEHTLWRVEDQDSDFFVKEFESIPELYIADGHHRAAAAYNVGKKRRDQAIAEGHAVSGDEDFNYFMSIIYSDQALKVLDYNRVIRSLNGLSTQDFLSKLSEHYKIEELKEGESPAPKQKLSHSLYIDKKWYTISIKEGLVDEKDPVKRLDVQILTDYCLRPILGIENLRNDERIDFVGGMRGLKELEKRCEEDCVAAFAMRPVEVDELMAIADAGMIMPPKSTWFEPKPRSGFVVRMF